MTDIAVVIPCFNLGRWIEDAIDSVHLQSRPATEVVVVDDGSTHLYTRQLLASFECPKTRIVRTANAGVSAARNHGIRLTSADYLVTLDADDRLHSEYLARTAARLDADPDLGFVSTAIRAFGEASYTWTPPSCTVINALIRGAAHPASMFRRQVWAAVGGFDESAALQGCEDLDFWLSAMELGFRGDVIAEPLLEYRVRAASVHQTKVSGGGQLRLMEAVFRKHRAIISEVGPRLAVEKDRFLQEQRAHHAPLVERKSALVEEIQALEAEIVRTAKELARLGEPPLDWRELAGLEPFSPVGRADRGLPIDRFYIRTFLHQHATDRRGDVLEILTLESPDRVDHAVGAPSATGLRAVPRRARLAEIPDLPSDSFDCVVAEDALRAAYDVRATLVEMHRILRTHGVLLCALPAARGLSGSHADDSDYWRFAEAAVRHLFAEVFPPEAFSVSGFGNVMACAASLAGLAGDELEAAELDFVDPMFPLTYCVRAVKA